MLNNRRLKIFLHIVFWAYMFLSPMQYMRGTGMPMVQYLMNCMSPLLLMILFYINFKWMTPKYFQEGKHRYYLIINAVLVFSFATILHYWMDYSNLLFQSGMALRRVPDAIDEFFFFIRDVINLTIFAAVATSISLAQSWYWADKARKDAETARVNAELSNLRNQINPHFLLNTLNNIYALTAFDQGRAQDAIQQLSTMLRHMLYDNQQELVALKDEVQFLENYVNLMKIRLPQNVEVRFDKRLPQQDVKIAPLIFVSLVENAFKHGVSPTEPSFIHISISVEMERLGDDGIRDVVVCLIENSNHPKTQQDRSGHGIGLEQVQRRLDLTYYNQYEWERGCKNNDEIYYSKLRIKL